MAATQTPRRREVLGIPRGVVLAVGWFAAVPWIVGVGRAGLWGGDLADGLVCVESFWVTFPAWLLMITGKRPTRPFAAMAVYGAVDAVPYVLLGVLAVIRGVFTTDVAQFVAVAWAATTTAGVAFGWLAMELSTRSRRWKGRGVVGRIWTWEAHQWWAASLAAVAIATLVSPVLFALANSMAQGATIVAMIVAATLLSWVIDVCGVDGRTLALEVLVSLPVMIASIWVQDVNAVVVLVLGVAAPVALAGVVARWSMPDTGGAPAGTIAAA